MRAVLLTGATALLSCKGCVPLSLRVAPATSSPLAALATHALRWLRGLIALEADGV